MKPLSRVAPRAALNWALLALLMLGCAWHALRQIPASVGVDLWHPWGIHVVREDMRVIGDPYTNAAAYARHLERLAAESASAREANAASFWASRGVNGFEPTGTPALYALMGFLPRDFDQAHLLWAVLTYLAAGWSGWSLARLRGASPALATAGAAVALLFNPILFDERTGNVACVQLASIVLALRLVTSGGAGERGRRFMPAVLAALVAFKPNVLPVAAALMAHYFFARPRCEWLRDLALAALVLVVLVIAGELAVGPVAWPAWWRYIHGMNGGTLLYSARSGNLAPAAWLAAWMPALGIGSYSAALAAFTAGAILAVATLAARPAGASAAVRRWLADP